MNNLFIAEPKQSNILLILLSKTMFLSMYGISIFNGPFLHISEWINNINIIWEPSAKFGDLLCNNISFLFLDSSSLYIDDDDIK